MTFPPPHQPQPGYSPVPPPPSGQTSGPGGAYGPVQVPGGQPVPGQLPPPEMTMTPSATLASRQLAKPGTITGIQVILWIFLALGAVGDVASAISMVNYFNAFSLIALGFAVYTTIQSLLTPIHIARGKRWAWIWNLVSTIIGLALSVVAIVFGAITVGASPIGLIVGIVLAGLYSTLLGLLCSKSARQWILMHRIQRGEVQLAGAPGGPGGPGAPGTMAPGFAAGGPMQRPDTKPGTVTATQVGLWILIGLGVVEMGFLVRWWMLDLEFFPTAAMLWEYSWKFYLPHAILAALLLLLPPITLFGIGRGKGGPRVFALVWLPVLLLGTIWWIIFEANERGYSVNSFNAMGAVSMLAYLLRMPIMVWVFVMLLLRGVRIWTGAKVSAPTVVVQVQYPGFAPQQQAYPPAPTAGQQPSPVQQQPPYPPHY